MNMYMRSNTFNWLNSGYECHMSSLIDRKRLLSYTDCQTSIVGNFSHSYIGSQLLCSINRDTSYINDGNIIISAIGNVNVK